MLRLVTIHVTKGTPAYPVSPAGQQPVRTNSCAEFMVWTNKTIKSMVLCYSSVRPGTKCGFRGGTPRIFFSNKTFIKILYKGSFIYIYIYILIRARPHVKFVRTNGSAQKISGACQWCHLPLKITWHHRVVTWASWRLRVHTCLFNNLSKQITKKTSKFRDPRLVTRDSRLKTSKVTSHEWRVGDSWLVTRDLGPPKSPVTSRGSRVGVANSPIVTRDYESRFLLADLNHGSRMNLERCETRIVSCMF